MIINPKTPEEACHVDCGFCDSAKSQMDRCEWHQSDPTFGGEWVTDCGTAFVFEVDEPLAEHGYNFCPKCGKNMVPFPFVYPEEDDEDADE